ncbi:MAG: hypothetical protein ACOZAA_11995 [Pseudomonadota bacterium]
MSALSPLIASERPQQNVIEKVIPLPCGALMMISNERKENSARMQRTGETAGGRARNIRPKFAFSTSADNPYKNTTIRVDAGLIPGALTPIIRAMRKHRVERAHAAGES